MTTVPSKLWTKSLYELQNTLLTLLNIQKLIGLLFTAKNSDAFVSSAWFLLSRNATKCFPPASIFEMHVCLKQLNQANYSLFPSTMEGIRTTLRFLLKLYLMSWIGVLPGGVSQARLLRRLEKCSSRKEEVVLLVQEKTILSLSVRQEQMRLKVSKLVRGLEGKFIYILAVITIRGWAISGSAFPDGWRCFAPLPQQLIECTKWLVFPRRNGFLCNQEVHRYHCFIIMNHYSCLVCDKPAVRACVHPKCDKIPFLCGDKCKHQQDMAVSLHLHDGQNKFIPIEQMQMKVANIRNASFGQHLDLMKKRLNILIGDLNGLMKTYENQLQKLEPKLTSKAKGIIDLITIKDNVRSLKGKDVAELIGRHEIYENQYVNQRTIEIVRRMMEDVLEKMEGAIVKGLVNVLNTENIKKSSEFFLEGTRLQASGKFAEALEMYKQAKLSNIPQPMYTHKIGLCYQQLGEFDHALKFYDESVAVSLSMGGKSKELPNTFCNIANILSNQRDYGKAIEFYSKALELKPDFSECFNNRGLTFYNLKSYEPAIKDYTRAIELDAGKANYYNNRGVAFLGMGLYKDAIADYTKAVTLSPTKLFYGNRAAAFEKVGDMERAKADKKAQLTAAER